MSWKYMQYQNGKMRTTDEDPGGASNFADLGDVSFSNLSNGQVPKYNSTTQKWENANESGGGGTVTDVEVDSVSVVNAQGVAEITMPVKGVKVNGTSVLDANKEAQIKSYKEVTQAQYEALPDSKLTDGILYAIKDGGVAIEGFPPLIYSSEEREIGVWCNGKPLYQKTWNLTVKNHSSHWIEYTECSIPNLDKICNTYYGIGNLGGRHYAYWSNDGTILLDVQTSSSATFWVGSNDLVGLNLVYTVQYTKTTDTPGSGTWTSQGTVAHHYSTTEHVVGTWTDGSPIYEVTYELSTAKSLSSSWSHSSIVITDIQKVIRVVSAINNDGETVPLVVGLYSGYELALAYSGGPSNSLKYFTIQYTKYSS